MSLTEIKLEEAIAPVPPLVSPETPVTEVIALMSAARTNCSLSLEDNIKDIISCVLIVQENRLLGIFTERDVVRLSAQGRSLAEIAIAEVMAEPVITLRRSEFTDIFTVLNLLQAHNLRHLPLLDEGDRPVGILTKSSLLNSFKPLELYKSLESLETKVSRLETEKRTWLETRNLELEQEVERRTAQLQAQIKREQLLGAIANQIRSSLDWQEIVDTTVREVRSLLECNAVVIWQFQPDGSTLAVAEATVSNQPSYLARQVKDACFTVNGLMGYRNGQIRVVPEIYTTEMSHCHREFLEQLKSRAKILVPILQGETLWGMLTAIETQAPRQWQTDEIELLKQLATQLAIALQQAAVLKQVETELAERKRVEAALQWQIGFDRLIAHISHRFMQLSFSELNHGIDHALQHMGEFLQVDTSYIFQYSDDRQTASMTHEWTAEDFSPQLENLQNLPCTAFPWATAKIGHGENISVSSLDQLPTEADLDRQAWQNLGVKSLLAIPLRDRQQVIGFVGFASLHSEQIWSENMIQILQIFSEILTHVIQRQQAEMELQSSERRYASLAEAAPVGIFRTDVQGHCLYVNNCWSQMTGLPASASLGTGWATFIHPDDRHQVVSEWQCSISKNTCFWQEFRVQHSEGEIYWVLSQAMPEHDAKGQVIGYVGTVTDISDRKRRELEQQIVENTLLKSERRYRHLIQAQTDLIMRSLPDTTITFANDSLCLALGRTLEEVIGLKWSNFVPPEDLDEINRKITALTPENPTFENINQDYRANHQIGWTQWINLGIFGDRGELVEIQSVGRDITPLQQQIQREQSLNRVFQSIRNSLDLDTIFATATAETAQLLKTLDCFVVQYLPEQGVWRHIAEFRHHRDTPTLIGLEIPDADNPFAAQLKQFQLVQVENTNNIDDQINQEIAQTLPGAWLLIPLVVEGSLWGSFAITASEQPFIWENEQVDIAQFVANQLEIAIQQANLYQQLQLELSDRKWAEEALIASERRLRTIIDAEPECVKILAADGTILEMNPAGLAMLEADTPSQVIGQKATSCILPEHHEAFAALGEQVFQGKTGQLEFAILGLKGAHRWVDSRAVPLRNEENETVGILSITRDITARKQAEIALAESERRLSTLIANLPGYVYRVVNDPNYTPEFISEGVYKITGYRQEEYLVDRTISCGQEIHPDDAEAIWNLIQQALENKQAYECEYRLITKTGETKWVWERGRGYWTQSGELLHLEGFVTDISDRKRAEGELQEKNAEMQAIFAAFPDLFFRMAADGTILDYRAKNTSDLYLPPEFFLNKRMQEVLPPTVVEQISAAITQVLQTKSLVYIEYSLPMPNHEEHFEARLVPFQEDQVVAIIRNISDRKAAQSELNYQKDLLQTTFDHLPVMVGVYSAKGEPLMINRELERVIGWNRAEYATVDVLRACYPHPEDYEQVLTHIITADSTWKDFKTLTRDGRLLDTSWAQIRLSDGRSIGIGQDVTDRKAAEAAIREQDRRLESIISSIDGVVWSCDAETLEILYVSPTAERLYGRSPSEFMSNSHLWFEMIHPDDRVAAAKDFEELRQTGSKVLEYRIIRTDGQLRWLQNNCHFLSDIDGQPRRIDGIATDITVLKAAQSALRDNEERLRLALTASHQGLYDLNIQTGEAIVNPEYALMLGYEPTEFQETNAKWIERLHPDDREPVAAIYRAYVNHEIPEYRVEFRQRTKTGDWKWILSLGKIVDSDREGNPLRMLGTHTDITEQKQAELALRESYQRYNSLVNRIPIGVYKFRMLVDGQQRFDYVSPHWCTLNQLSQEEVLQDASLAIDRVHPDDRDRFIYLNDQAKTTLNFTWEGRMLTGEKLRWMHMESSPTLLENGDIVWDGIQYDITDRIQAEQERERLLAEAIAARSEATKARDMLSTIFERMNDGIVALDNQWHYTYLNKNGAALLGRTPEQLIGKHIWTEFPEGIDQPFYKAYYRAVAEQKPIYLEDYYEPWDRWFENRIYPSDDGLTIYFTDISDRKQAEATRLQAEKLKLELTLLEKILNIVLAGYWDWDIPNYIAYMSPGLKRMFGYEDAELPNVPETWQRLIFPEDLPKTLECFDQHVQSRGEVPYYNEVRYRHKNGSTVWVICSGQVIEWDEQGNPLRMIGCHVNITGRKQAEDKLKQQLAAIEAAVDGIGILQGDNYIFLNSSHLSLFGYDRPEDLMGKTWRNLYSPEEILRFECEVFPPLRRNGYWEGEAIATRKDGSTFAQGLSLTITDDGLLICVCRDISDRKQTEEQLQQKTQQLEATNRELESFSYSVSHDLRAPLRHINGFVNALRQQLQQHSILDDPKVARYLEVIEGSSQKMALLIDGLLTLSRMTRRQIEYKPVNIKQLVEEAIFFIQSNTGESTPVEFVLGHLSTVIGDEILLQQVFSNLIDNAVKFSRNHPTPLVEIGSLPDRTIFIKDNGVGFSMEYADKLFGAFQRLHSQKEFEGTGIGLAIVQRIIHRHGGTIWVESQLGRGTTFYFKI